MRHVTQLCAQADSRGHGGEELVGFGRLRLSTALGIMNIQSLCAEVYADSEGLLRSLRTGTDGSLLIDFECDDWAGTGERRRFEIRCDEPKDFRVDVGYIGAISLHTEHSLLLKHQGEQAELYFSSAPASPEAVFTQACIMLHTELDGWREPSELLHGTPGEFVSNLRSGHGLLARGPMPTLLKLRDQLAEHLKLQLVHSYVAKGEWVVLVMEGSWIVCARVEAHENDA